ncbi:N-terminal nucleophile aminohydrolase [Auriscalpium vulgare]|uniref:N-terminal nucleophile aminohydrolase n=1 Tax=Auriscalpium vulgare TaxID=40419 RepID=A0ACB8S074_9AGAM|nr:N-terminal nucleophile aminohydrolase [Auriscalpium vulgare]
MSEKAPLLPHPKGNKPSKSKTAPVLVVHGGAGTMRREGSTPAQQARYKAALAQALRAGHAVLAAGGEAMDAVVAAVTVLEDNPLFNSGKGAVFNAAGKNELEASLALSRPPDPDAHPAIPPTRRALALTLLTRTRNPSHLARQLFLAPDLTPHPFLSGAHAEALSAEPPVADAYFWTAQRWREHRRGLGLPEEDRAEGVEEGEGDGEPLLDLMPGGTVGAVALDARGCLAVCTSTGGLTNKAPGRIGDTPHLGAGFWAGEWRARARRWWPFAPRGRGVAVSGTGVGDYFIRQNTAATIARRMEYLCEPLGKAAGWAVEALREDGGDGGVIAVDASGNVAMPLNCTGMYRGVIRADGVPKTAIFADDELEIT